MFINFFLELRKNGLKPSIKEYLHLLEGLDKGVIGKSIDEFYYLSRATLVKNEAHLDRFDVLFGRYFQGMMDVDEDFWADLPDDQFRQWKYFSHCLKIDLDKCSW